MTTVGGIAQTERPKSRGRTAKSAMKVKVNNERFRMMLSPRSKSRRSQPRNKVEKVSKRSQGSLPDSPQKELPGQIEPPFLPTPVMSFAEQLNNDQL